MFVMEWEGLGIRTGENFTAFHGFYCQSLYNDGTIAIAMGVDLSGRCSDGYGRCSGINHRVSALYCTSSLQRRVWSLQ